MYELIPVSSKCYYMDCPSKVGFYKTGDKDVVLIDSGSDKDAGKKVKRILDEKGWSLKAIYNTHSHADHIGGNQYLQTQTGCRIYAKGIERAFTEFPVLEPNTLFGGNALEELHNKFLMAKESNVEELTADVLPEGLTLLSLPGHSYDMVGFRSDDDVVFLADALFSENVINKYKIGFLYDVEKYLETLQMVEAMKAACFVPSHVDVCEDISALAGLNIETTKAIAETIRNLLNVPKTFDDLLADLFDSYNLTMDLSQRMLVGCTVKSYLKYLADQKAVTAIFEENKMKWQRL